MRCHPGRWLWGLIPVAMLSWLAVQAERSSIERDLERRSREVLAASGHDWASIVFDGRDGLLVGDADKPGAIAEAAALVRNVWGVRVVRTRERVTAIATGRQVVADVPMTPAATVGRPSTEFSDRPPADPGAQYGLQAPPDPIASAGNSTNAPKTIAAVEVVGRRAKEIGVSSIPLIASRELAMAEPPASATSGAMAQAPSSKARDIAVLQASAAAMQGGAAVVGSAETKIPIAAVELPEHKPGPQPSGAGASVSVPQLPQHKPPLSGAEAAPAPEQAEEQPSAAAKASVIATAPVSAPVPDRKPDIAMREASPQATDLGQRPEVFAMPAADGEKSVRGAASTIAEPIVAAKVPMPEPKKPVLSAARETNAARAAVLPRAGGTAPKPVTAQQPASPPRFETAALPPGNMAADVPCVKDVEAAAELARIHFAPDVSTLDTPGKSAIDGLVASLRACPGLALRISGHADASGQSRHNKTLSERRARSVAAYIIDKGIDAGRLVAVGYGDKQPVAPNDREANRAKNRRIELAITVQRAPLPPLPVRKQGTRNGLSGR